MPIKKNENSKIIFENSEYSLIANTEYNNHLTVTHLKVHFNSNNFEEYIGSLINKKGTEWVEANDLAIAILRNDNIKKDNEILYLYYIAKKSFIFGNNKQLNDLYNIFFSEQKHTDNQKVKVYDLKKD